MGLGIRSLDLYVAIIPKFIHLNNRLQYEFHHRIVATN